MIRLLAICLLLAIQPAWSKQPRSHASVAEFKRQHPCPSTGKPRGSCPGYVVDHVVPLCAQGADDPSNMQWQTVADGKAKDKTERQQCAKRKTTI